MSLNDVIDCLYFDEALLLSAFRLVSFFEATLPLSLLLLSALSFWLSSTSGSTAAVIVMVSSI